MLGAARQRRVSHGHAAALITRPQWAPSGTPWDCVSAAIIIEATSCMDMCARPAGKNHLRNHEWVESPSLALDRLVVSVWLAWHRHTCGPHLNLSGSDREMIGKRHGTTQTSTLTGSRACLSCSAHAQIACSATTRRRHKQRSDRVVQSWQRDRYPRAQHDQIGTQDLVLESCTERAVVSFERLLHLHRAHQK